VRVLNATLAPRELLAAAVVELADLLARKRAGTLFWRA